MLLDYESGQIGSVGHLVGAAFETSGHYLQAVILDALETGVAAQVGTFLFVLAAVGAIFVTAMGGHYKAFRWFLVGPLLFTWLISVRVPSQGAEWRFGDRHYPQARVTKAVQDHQLTKTRGEVLMLESGEPVRVLWFFSVWNRITSSVAEGLVSLIRATSENADLNFVLRGERLEMLLNSRITDPKLKAFVHLTAVNRCADYYILIREYHQTSTDDARRRILRAKIAARGAAVRMTLDDLPEIRNWAKELGILEASKDIFGAKGENTALTCDQLWALSVRALQKSSALLVDRIADATRPDGVSKAQVVKEMQDKLTTGIVRSDDHVDVLDDNQKVLLVVNFISARMLLAEMREYHPDYAGVDFDRQAPVGPALRAGHVDQTVSYLRELQATEQYVGKGDFLTAMLALPYIQGYIFCVLAATLPLFLFSLVIPGRHGGVKVWMGLWAWVKGWDPGLAVVMQADKLIYPFLPTSLPLSDTEVVEPAAAIKAMLANDATYSIHVYYNILATLIAAVPLITGLLVKKGGQELVHYTGDRLTQFSGRIGFAMASHARSLLAQAKLAQVHRNVYAAVQRGIWRAFLDEDILHSLGVRKNLMAQTGLMSQGGFWGNVGATMAGAAMEQRLNIAMAKYAMNLHTIAYKEHMHPANILLANQMKPQGYYSHYANMRPPGEEELEFKKQLVNFQFGGPLAQAFNQAPGATFGPWVPIPGVGFAGAAKAAAELTEMAERMQKEELRKAGLGP